MPEPATTVSSSGVAAILPHPPDTAAAFSSPGVAPLAMSIYRENPFSEFVSIQTKEPHPGESRGPEHVEIPLWRNWIAAFAAVFGHCTIPHPHHFLTKR
jgi:hypothetical protein